MILKHFLRNRSRWKNMFTSGYFECVSSKFWKSYTPPAIPFRVNILWDKAGSVLQAIFCRMHFDVFMMHDLKFPLTPIYYPPTPPSPLLNGEPVHVGTNEWYDERREKFDQIRMGSALICWQNVEWCAKWEKVCWNATVEVKLQPK
jgi:hypothetical protein